MLISPKPDQEGNKLQRQKILIFIYLIYNHNWRNISTKYIYIYKTRLASKEIFSPSNKLHRELGQAKDLSAPLYVIRSCIDVQFSEPSRCCSNNLDCVPRLPGAWCLVLVPVPDLNLNGNTDY